MTTRDDLRRQMAARVEPLSLGHLGARFNRAARDFTYTVLGSTGTAYAVTPHGCTCPDYRNRHRHHAQCCKHIYFVLHHVLQCELEDVQTQPWRHLLSTRAPRDTRTGPRLPHSLIVRARGRHRAPEVKRRKRRVVPYPDAAPSSAPAECAICCQTWEEEDEVRVQGRCFHEFHRSCLAGWLGTKRQDCPLCRRPWEERLVVVE